MSGSLTATTRLPDAAAERLDNWPKSLPPVAAGRSVGDFLAGRPRLSEFSTPLLVLDDGAMAHNTARMAGWCADRRVALAPHGKTTMAPALWQRQLDAGAWGITVATASQLWVAVAARGAPGAAGQRTGRPGRADPAGRAARRRPRSCRC